MAFGNWNDNRTDWFNKTPHSTACPKLDNITKNSHALIKQETFVNWGRDEFDPFVSTSWGVRAYMGLTLYGTEPYDNVVFALNVACAEEGWPLLTYMNVWFRVYNVERDEYYPNATGIQMYSLPTWILGFPFPGWQFQTLLIEADMTPPAGAWTARSYELQIQTKYSPSATQRLGKMRGFIGTMERS